MTEESHGMLEVSEKYISEQVLPFEQINCWLKWKGNPEFDEIVISYPDYINTRSFLNVDEKVLTNYSPYAKELIIQKEWLQVDGFFGMKSVYANIPSSKIEIEFKIRFINKEQNQQILEESFVTTITRPRIRATNLTPEEFIIDEMDSKMSLKLRLQLQILDNPNVTNIRRFHKIVTSNNEISISIRPERSQIPEIAIEPVQVREMLTVTGKGMAIVRVVFEYEDFIGNKYSTEPIEITIQKRTVEPSHIPVERFIEGSVPLLVSK